jgi:hypothetical protein
MPLDRKSTISGALIAYLIITAIQAIALSFDHSKSFDFSVAINYGIAILMLISAWMIFKERKSGFITAALCILITTIWNFSVLIEHPVISSTGFWMNIGIYITVLFLASSYALRKKGA